MSEKSKQKQLFQVDLTQPLYSPRANYHLIREQDKILMQDLTLNFDPFTINILKNEFAQKPLNLTQFVSIIKDHLLFWKTDTSNREEKVLRCLSLLFSEIDVNGSNTVDWEEFTNFIAEKANNTKSVDTQKEIKQYQPSHHQLKNQNFQNVVSQIIYIPIIDRIAYFEDGSDEIHFFNHDNGMMHPKSLKVSSKPLSFTTSTIKKEQDGSITIEKKDSLIPRKSMILDMIYIPQKKYQILVTSSNDGLVRGWKYTNNGFQHAVQPDNEDEYIEHQFKTEIHKLEWDQAQQVIFCGQRNGNISGWNLKTDTEFQLEQVHTKVIQSIISMPKLQFIASAGLDGYLVIWDTINYQKKKIYKEHKRGIVSLAFNEQLIQLISAGFDHEIYVWNPYIDQYIFKIIGHNSPIVGVLCPKNSQQIVSLDQDGVLKIWDVKNFECVQTETVQLKNDAFKLNPQCICAMENPLKLFIGGISIIQYDYDRNFNPQSVDDFPALCAKFNPLNLTLITPHGNRVKCWSMLTGNILITHKDIIQNGIITCFIVDDIFKRMIIGDSNGNTGVYNIFNGSLLKSLPKHNQDIIKILHIAKEQLIITAGFDHQIKVSKEINLNTSQLIKTITMDQLTVTDQITTSLDFDYVNQMLVQGTNTGSIIFWDFLTGNLGGICQDDTEHDITSLCKIPGCPFYLVSNRTGNFSVISCPPLLEKFKHQFTFKNMDDQGYLVGIIQMVIYQLDGQNCLLFIDEKNQMKCYNIEGLIKKVKIDLTDKKNLANFIPLIEANDIFLVWKVKAHQEQLISVEYVFQENIIVTTAHDKRVKIWSDQGKLIEQLQQNSGNHEFKPLGYVKIGTKEIYSSDFQDRIDMEYCLEMQQKEQQKLKQNDDNQDDKNQDQKDQQKHFNSKIDKMQEMERIKNYIRSYEEEFEPTYFNDLIYPGKIFGKHSNEWKLYIDFLKYHYNNQAKFDETKQQLKNLDIENNLTSYKQRRAKMSNLNDNQIPDFDGKAQQILMAEENNQIQKEKQIEKQRLIDLKMCTDQKKEARFKKYAHIESKINKNDLKSTKIVQSDEIIPKLSKEERNAAHKLAAALSNYDENDTQCLKFLDVQLRKNIKEEKKSEPPNFIDQNKNSINKMMQEINIIKMKQVQQKDALLKAKQEKQKSKEQTI